MRRKFCVLLLLLLTVFLTGCQGARETEDEAFIIAMGIDKAEENKLKFTFVIALTRSSGGRADGEQKEEARPSVIKSIIAPSAAEARNLLVSSMSRYANISHLRTALIAEELAQTGISDVLSPLVRYREFRGGIFVLITKGTAENFLLQNKPKLDTNAAKFFESMIISGSESAYYVRSDLHEVYLGLKNPGRSAYATYVAINPKSGDDVPQVQKPKEAKADTYKAEELPRSGTSNPAEFAGLAVFSGDKMTGVLDTRSTRVLYILQAKLHNDRLVIADPLQPKRTIQFISRVRNKPDISSRLVDGRQVIQINLELEGEIISNPSGINYEKGEYKELLEQQISNLTKEEIQRFISETQAFGSDVFGFGRFLRGNFRTYKELQDLNFENLYKNASVEVEVKTIIRRSGLMWRTSPVKPGATL